MSLTHGSSRVHILQKEHDFFIGNFWGAPGQNFWILCQKTIKFRNFLEKVDKEKVMVC